MLVLVGAVYLPAVSRAGFLGFDDNLFFGPDNPEFQEGLGAVLDPRRTIANVYLPVAHLSLWLDWRFGGGPLWPHLVSLLLHAAVAIALIRLLLALRLQPLLAHLAGALFALHPALAESVAWVSGRKELLSGLFVLLGLQQCVAFAARPGFGRGALIASLGALAMYSKATAMVQPLLAVLVCLLAPVRDRRWFVAPVLLLLVTVPALWHHAHLAAQEGTMAAGEPTGRLWQAPGALWHYARTVLWPVQLNVLYPEVLTLQRFRADWLAGLLVLGALLVAVALLWRRPATRAAAAGLAFALVAFLPFNTAFPASAIAAADRYLYLVLPGVAMGAAALASRLPRWSGAALLALLLLPLGWRTADRAAAFTTDEALWSSSLAVEPQNAVAHYNLAMELLRRPAPDMLRVTRHLDQAAAAARYPIHALRARQQLRRLALAQAHYQEAALHAQRAIAAAEQQLQQETTAARRTAATVLLAQAQLDAFEPLRLAGDEAAAERCFEQAKALVPTHPDVVAFAALRQLRPVAAEMAQAAANGQAYVLPADDPRGLAADALLEPALQESPRHAGLLCALAAWETVRDRPLSALKYYRRALAADPACVDAWLSASRLLRDRGNFADAETYARNGLRVRPDPALRQELAMALVGQGRLDDAIAHLEAYLQVRPKDRDAARALSNVLISKAYARLSASDAPLAEVQQLVDRALAWNPAEPKASLVRGRMLRTQRRFAEAVRELELAHRSMPDFEDARRLLADSYRDLGTEHWLAGNEQGAGDAWLAYLRVAPADDDVDAVRIQLRALWRRAEQRGIELRQRGDQQGAIACFRRCLQLDPDQHWASWLLALSLHEQPDADPAEVERLLRQAVAWQQQHQLDQSQQVYLLATVLQRSGRQAESEQLARSYLEAPDPEARPQVLAALRRLANR